MVGTRCHVRKGHIGGGKVLALKKTGWVWEPPMVRPGIIGHGLQGAEVPWRRKGTWIACRSILISGEL